MARRDFERILGELGDIRQAVHDSSTGLTGLRKDQEDLRRKVLETVQQGTAGLREENRELRRRQEKMLTDLADARTGVEALRRELAQAFSHILGAADPARVAERGSSLELVEREPRPLDVADVEAGDGWREEAVNEIPGPVSDGEEEQRARDGLPEVVTAPASATQVSPAVDATSAEPSAGSAAPASGDAERQREEDRAQHLESVLRAAAIASARVICHRDTWSFLIEQTSQHPHFRLPDRINDLDDGMIETSLSGRSVLAVLVTKRKVSDDHASVDKDVATWALACAVYQRARMAVTDTTRTRLDGAQVTTIVLDDRPTTTSQAA
ncbi:hypothetical protein FNH09_13370 [Streptomyces adustus]|uniref:Uncharacterized protein n=1 Tax=Streptomyces adustus TaxID=1609272 RepID=A0A5N8VAJ9_9ACTN|nr:hypothetical protein [Streptomyces adustus]MPY32237.1 hypothetical protein [Streptomyces adustus]